MKEFFTGMNLPRIVILIFFPVSGFLAWFEFNLETELGELRVAESEEAPEVVRKIQEHSIRLTQLQSQLDDEVWIGQDNPGSYVRTVAQDGNVRLGQVDVVHSKDDKLGNGVVDKKWTIHPVDKDRGWSKDNLGNFLYMLESESQRIRVTRAKIQQIGKRRSKPHEIPPDEWTFEVEITSRQRE